MKILTLLTLILFIACERAPRTIDGINPHSITVNGQMILLDMGYVNGTINGKKLHAYRVM